ncbi:hypothetical protein [Clostridium sp. 1001283B150225_161107_B6]|nr:hypothetical protein [Clostridium sp. 1001283B150225_161107_B6]
MIDLRKDFYNKWGVFPFYFIRTASRKEIKKILAFIWNMCYHTKAVA